MSKLVTFNKTGLPCEELCDKVTHCLGAFVTLLPLLGPICALQLQMLSKWFYNHGINRAQQRLHLPAPIYFTTNREGKFANEIFVLEDQLTSPTIQRFTPSFGTSQKTFHKDWISCMLNSQRLFQLKDGHKACRLIKVNHVNQTYKINHRTPADKSRARFPAVCFVREQSIILAIGGMDDNLNNMASVSVHDLQ